MAQSLPSIPAAATTPLSANSKKNPHEPLDHKLILPRRSLALGLTGAVLGLQVGDGSAKAAGRRPPPPPQNEKKDPNVSGLLAKVLASKKRKEAMKEAVAKLRERGKSVE